MKQEAHMFRYLCQSPRSYTCLHIPGLTTHSLSLTLQDHIQEVLGKWESIDDEIWAKVIVLERNRRVAKAYARAPVLTVNGSDDGFDGFRYACVTVY